MGPHNNLGTQSELKDTAAASFLHIFEACAADAHKSVVMMALLLLLCKDGNESIDTCRVERERINEND